MHVRNMLASLTMRISLTRLYTTELCSTPPTMCSVGLLYIEFPMSLSDLNLVSTLFEFVRYVHQHHQIHVLTRFQVRRTHLHVHTTLLKRITRHFRTLKYQVWLAANGPSLVDGHASSSRCSTLARIAICSSHVSPCVWRAHCTDTLRPQRYIRVMHTTLEDLQRLNDTADGGRT